jgi:MoxR-like ATPase
MNIQKMAEQVKDNISQVIVGEDEVIELALVALLGGLQQ